MPDATASRPEADRNLLLGILALQMDFVSRDALIAAMHAWVMDKSKPLGQILVEQNGLSVEHRAMLEPLVEAHIKMHGNEPEKSLASLSTIGSVRDALIQMGDPDVHASLCHVSQGTLSDDPHATRPVTAEQASAYAVSRFRILRPHARGGLGEVFVAEDQELHREVALKEIQGKHANHADSRSRFMLEAEITGGLEHPGVVPVYGLGTYPDGRPFYAMRFVKGDSLQETIKRFHEADVAGRDPAERELALRRLLGRFIDVCEAVAYAHSRGVLHRDLKPGNIMLGKYGETLVVDWGLAKIKGRDDAGKSGDELTLQPQSGSGVEATAEGQAIGTPAYMSPEQAAGKVDQIGPASDVYSLGATLYAVLTGKPAFHGESGYEILTKVQKGEFLPPHEIKRNVPPALEAICLKAMALAPQDRYATPRGLVDDLEHWLADEPLSAFVEPLTVRTSRWVRKHKPVVSAAGALLVTAVIGLSTGVVLLRQEQARTEARRLEAVAESIRADQEREGAERQRQQAVAQKDRAMEAERKAKEEADIARATNTFLQEDLLGQADIGNQPFLGTKTERNPNITVMELLDRAAKTVEEKFKQQPLTEAAIRQTLGNTYLALGQYPQAQQQLEESLRLRSAEVGADHPDTLAAKSNLAMLCRAQARFTKAELLYKAVLDSQTLKLGSNHADTLATKNLLGALYRDQGQYSKAESLHRAVLEAQIASLGSDNLITQITKNDLAELYRKQGKYAKAEPLYKAVVDTFTANLGADHPNTLMVKNNLATLYRAEGQFGKAESLYKVVIEASATKLGPHHPKTLTMKNNLALVYLEQGQYAQAEILFKAVLDAQTAKLGADHPGTLATKNNLAALYKAQAQYDKAEPLLKSVLEALGKGGDHPDTLTVKGNLAELYRAQGKNEKALQLLKVVLDAEIVKLGVDHPSTLSTKNNLALLYRDEGQYAKAEPLFKAVLKACNAKLGIDHPNTLLTKNNLAVLYLAQAEYAKAEPLLIDAVEGYRKKPGIAHPYYQAYLANLTRCWEKMDKASQAEPLLRELADYLRNHEGVDSVRYGAQAALLGGNSLQQKKVIEAEATLRESLAIRKKHEPDTWTTFETQSILGQAFVLQKKYAEAEPLLLGGYEGMKQRAAKIPPVFKVRLMEAVTRLIELYDATDKKTEVDKWRKELEALETVAKPGK